MVGYMVDKSFLLSFIKKRDISLGSKVFSSFCYRSFYRKAFLSRFVILKNNFKPSKVFILGVKSYDFYDFSNVNDVTVLGSFSEYCKAKTCGAGFYNLGKLYRKIFRFCFKDGSKESLEFEVLQLSAFFVEYGLPNSKLIVHSDALPLARGVIVAARKAGLEIVCLQHGLFSYDTNIDEIDGTYSDVNYARSENQKNVMISNGVRPETIRVMPSLFYKVKKPLVSITFVGEGFLSVSNELHEKTMRCYKGVRSLLSQGLGLDFDLDFFYRPHPSEKNGLQYCQIEGVGLERSISESNYLYRFYIGCSSTYLVDVVYQGYEAIQVRLSDQVFESRRLDCEQIQYLDEYEIVNYILEKISSSNSFRFYRDRNLALDRFKEYLLS